MRRTARALALAAPPGASPSTRSRGWNGVPAASGVHDGLRARDAACVAEDRDLAKPNRITLSATPYEAPMTPAGRQPGRGPNCRTKSMSGLGPPRPPSTWFFRLTR